MRSLKITLTLTALVAVFLLTVSYNSKQTKEVVDSIEKIDNSSRNADLAEVVKKKKKPGAA